jgi:hypothetical protein
MSLITVLLLAQSVFRYESPDRSIALQANGGAASVLGQDRLKFELKGAVKVVSSKDDLGLDASSMTGVVRREGKGQVIENMVATGGVSMNQGSKVRLNCGSATVKRSGGQYDVQMRGGVTINSRGATTATVTGSSGQALLGQSGLVRAELSGGVRINMNQKSGNLIATGQRLDVSNQGRSIRLSGGVKVRGSGTGGGGVPFGTLDNVSEVRIELDSKGQLASLRWGS